MTNNKYIQDWWEIPEVKQVEPKIVVRKNRKLRYNLEFKRKIRFEVMERDFNGCVSCGTKQPLAVHHKDRNSLNDDWDNLITLCTGCHRVEHPYLPNILFEGVRKL